MIAFAPGEQKGLEEDLRLSYKTWREKGWDYPKQFRQKVWGAGVGAHERIDMTLTESPTETFLESDEEICFEDGSKGRWKVMLVSATPTEKVSGS